MMGSSFTEWQTKGILLEILDNDNCHSQIVQTKNSFFMSADYRFCFLYFKLTMFNAQMIYLV